MSGGARVGPAGTSDVGQAALANLCKPGGPLAGKVACRTVDYFDNRVKGYLTMSAQDAIENDKHARAAYQRLQEADKLQNQVNILDGSIAVLRSEIERVKLRLQGATTEKTLLYGALNALVGGGNTANGLRREIKQRQESIDTQAKKAEMAQDNYNNKNADYEKVLGEYLEQIKNVLVEEDAYYAGEKADKKDVRPLYDSIVSVLGEEFAGQLKAGAVGKEDYHLVIGRLPQLSTLVSRQVTAVAIDAVSTWTWRDSAPSWRMASKQMVNGKAGSALMRLSELGLRQDQGEWVNDALKTALQKFNKKEGRLSLVETSNFGNKTTEVWVAYGKMRAAAAEKDSEAKKLHELRTAATADLKAFEAKVAEEIGKAKQVVADIQKQIDQNSAFNSHQGELAAIDVQKAQKQTELNRFRLQPGIGLLFTIDESISRNKRDVESATLDLERIQADETLKPFVKKQQKRAAEDRLALAEKAVKDSESKKGELLESELGRKVVALQKELAELDVKKTSLKSEWQKKQAAEQKPSDESEGGEQEVSAEQAGAAGNKDASAKPPAAE